MFERVRRLGNFPSILPIGWIKVLDVKEKDPVWKMVWNSELHERLVDVNCCFKCGCTETGLRVLTGCHVVVERGLWFPSRWNIRIDSWSFSSTRAFVQWLRDHSQLEFIPPIGILQSSWFLECAPVKQFG